MLRFEWDKRKAARNLKKHGVTFDEASTLFSNPLACIFDDEDHSSYEPREIIVGHSVIDRPLVVSFIEKHDGVIRIISARLATRREKEDYEQREAEQS